MIYSFWLMEIFIGNYQVLLICFIQNISILAEKNIKYFESLEIESPFVYKANKQER